MAIRFDSDYNAEIRRIVKNFNAKRNRAVKRGFKYVPDRVYVSDLKKRYTSRKLLNRELKLLQRFNQKREQSLEIIENLQGAKMVSWEWDYLKANINNAKEFYDREIADAAKMDTNMAVAKAEYINNLKSKRAYLDMEISQLNPSQLKTYRKTVDEYLFSSSRNLDAYRGWLKEVEVVMKNLGYSSSEIKRFFDGFDQLSPRQFVQLYRENSLVSRIYELYIPTRDGSFKLSTDEEDAKNLIDTLNEEKYELIEKMRKM